MGVAGGGTEAQTSHIFLLLMQNVMSVSSSHLNSEKSGELCIPMERKEGLLGHPRHGIPLQPLLSGLNSKGNHELPFPPGALLTREMGKPRHHWSLVEPGFIAHELKAAVPFRFVQYSVFQGCSVFVCALRPGAFWGLANWLYVSFRVHPPVYRCDPGVSHLLLLWLLISTKICIEGSLCREHELRMPL